MKRLVIAVCIALVAAALGARHVFFAADTAAASAARLERWPLDVTRTFSLHWEQRQSSAMAGIDGPAEGELELDARVNITARLADGAKRVLVLELQRVDRFDAKMFGQTLPADGLEGAQAWVSLDDQGGLEQLRFSDREGAAARYLLQGVAGELFATVPDALPQVVKERLITGDLRTVLAWADAEHRTLVRQRVSFLEQRLAPRPPAHLEVDSRAELRFAATGPLEAISGAENIAGTDSDGRPVLHRTARLEVKLVAEQGAAPQVLSLVDRSEVRTPGPLSSEIDQRQALIESAVGDLTFEAVLETFARYTDPREIPSRAQFVFRAAALLKLHPERAKELVGSFTVAGSAPMRAQLLEVLASAGAAQAQAAMLEMLQSPAARLDSAAYPQLYQRLSLLKYPTHETVQRVLDDHAAALHGADAEARRTRAYTLGSLAHHVRAREPQLARLAGDVLLDDVAQAPTAEDRAHALHALGNTGDPRALEAVKALGPLGDPKERAGAAMALRQVEGPAAEQTLGGMLRGESHAKAQAAVLEALRHRELSTATLTTVRELALGQLDTPATRALLTLLAEQPASAEVVQALQAVAGSRTTASSLRQQARTLLGRFES